MRTVDPLAILTLALGSSVLLAQDWPHSPAVSQGGKTQMGGLRQAAVQPKLA
jgi:hypothetical protein